MRSVWVWLILALPAGWAVWQLQLTEPAVARPLLGLLLLALGLLAGLRLATEGLDRLLQDLIHANKHLADQVDQLTGENASHHPGKAGEGPDARGHTEGEEAS